MVGEAAMAMSGAAIRAGRVLRLWAVAVQPMAHVYDVRTARHTIRTSPPLVPVQAMGAGRPGRPGG